MLDIQNQEALGYLGELTGEEYLRRAENLSIQRAFNMNQTRGSRNVQAGSHVGGFLGNLVGAKEAGRAVGAGLGYAADVIGTRQYQRLLDMSLRPSVAKFLDVAKRAGNRSPQVVAQAYQELMVNDPEIARLMQSQSEER